MIKAEVNTQRNLTEYLVMCGVTVEAKGTHEDLVHEVTAIIDSFIEKEDYKDDILHIIGTLLERELTQLEKNKKENI